MRKLNLLLVLCLCITKVFSWDLYNTTNSGLPSNKIRGLDFDQNGNIWIATDAGLAKFNGSSWVVYNTSNSSIISNDIWCIKIDKNNVKWVGTSSGLSKYNDSVWVSYTSSNSGLIFNHVLSIEVDNNNSKYLVFGGNTGYGFMVYNDVSWSHYTVNNSSLFGNSVRRIIVDSLNNKWILYGSQFGYSPTRYTIIDSAQNWTTNTVANGEAWFGSINIYKKAVCVGSQNAFNILLDTGWQRVYLPNGISGQIISIKADKSSNNIWMVLQSNSVYIVGIYNLITNSWIISNKTNSPVNLDGFEWWLYPSIFEDNSNNNWIISSNGLIKLRCISTVLNSSTDSNYFCMKDSVMLTFDGTNNPSLWLSKNSLRNKHNTNVYFAKDVGIHNLFFKDDNGCSILGSSIYNVGDFFSITIQPNQNISCLRNNDFSFSPLVSEDSTGIKLSWNLVRTSSSIFRPSISFDTAGSYIIRLVATSIGGCIDSSETSITVIPNPNAGPMLGDSFNLKTSVPYVYSVQQQLNHNYNWIVSNGIIFSGQNSNAATVQWLSNGSGSVKVVVTNPQGCTDTTSKQVSIGNVGLKETTSFNNLLVYPNPNNGSFQVSLQAIQSGSIRLSLVNVLGQELWNENTSVAIGENIIPVNTPLVAGMYTLQVISEEKQVLHKIIIK